MVLMTNLIIWASMSGMRQKQVTHSRALYNDAIVILFALASVAFLGLELTGDISSASYFWIRLADTGIALFFLVEYIIRLRHAKNKRRFLLLHWWELLAAIPVTSTITQALRGARFVRVIELLSVFRASSRLEVTGELLGAKTQTPFIFEAIASLFALLFVVGVAFFELEFGLNPNVHSLWDAFWWATTTFTTTGYGDITPVTTGGRIFAMIVMFMGVIAVAVFTGTVVRYLSLRQRIGSRKK